MLIPFKDRFNSQCHKWDSTSNPIKENSTIKPYNMIQCEFHSKTDSTIKPQKGIKVNSIQIQIQPLNTQIGFNVNAIQKQI